MCSVYIKKTNTYACIHSLINDLDTYKHAVCLFAMLRDAIMNERDRTLYTLAVRPSLLLLYIHFTISNSNQAHTCLVQTFTQTHVHQMCRCKYVLGAGLIVLPICVRVLFAFYVCVDVYVRFSGIGSQVDVGGAVYVHPIRILFYDRRVIMCAVMLNSTYLL